MRITTQTIARNFILNLNKHVSRLNRYQNEVSTGKKLTKPSHDPEGSSRVLEIRSQLNNIDQYIRNIEDGLLHYSLSEENLNEVQNLTVRTRDLAVMASNSSMNSQDRKTMAIEVNQLLKELLTIANKKSSGKYIFGGTQTDVSPFHAERDDQNEISSVTVQGDITGKITRTIGKNHQINVNTDVKGILYGDSNLFDSLIRLRDALRNGEQNKISTAIEELNNLHNQTVSKITEIGVKYNSLTSQTDKLDSESVHLMEQLSNIEEADLAESIIQLQQEELAYKAALNTGGQYLRTTLLNFLK